MESYRYWIIYGEEELPLALAWAKTAGGAMKKYEKNTGRTRDGIHVVPIDSSAEYTTLISTP